MLHTSVGQLLVNDALPEDLRSHDRVLDKKGATDLLREVAQRYPEKYREVSKALADIGHRVASEFGGFSFGLQHLHKADATKANQAKLQQQLNAIIDDDSLDDATRSAKIVKAISAGHQQHIDDVYADAVKHENPLAMQVVSGSRGNKMNLASLLGGDRLYVDHRDRPLPLPVMRSYAEGLTPMEYVAGTYGARKGILATKLSTAAAGYFSKRIAQASHRLMVVDEDDERDLSNRGMPVDTDDADNAGSLLAADYGPYKRNVVLTPKITRHLKSLGHDRLLVRSPIVGGSPDGGVYSRDVGLREDGKLPGRGAMTGMTAAQAIGEPTSSGSLSVKHSGGVAGQEKSQSGFAAIDQMVEVPKTFKGGAAHAEADGSIGKIEAAPAGGHYVWIGSQRHYVPASAKLTVKAGDTVEAGDVLSTGEPNPATIVKHKGIGEGRRYFAYAFRDAMRAANMKADRRNTELLARGLINHVRLNDEWEDYVPDDVVLYNTMERMYQPREGHSIREPERALNHYLEKPVLHYSVGTKIRPSVVKNLKQFGIPNVVVHPEPPPFEPEMIRASNNLQYDPDPFTRLYGSGLKKSLLDATHRGSVSDESGTSFVPSLMRGVDFGQGGRIRQPEPGIASPGEGIPVGQAPALPKPRSLLGGLFKRSAEDLAASPPGTHQSSPGSSTVSTSGAKPLAPAPAGGAAPKAPVAASVVPKPPVPVVPPAVPATHSLVAPPPAPSPVSPPAPPGEVHPARAEALHSPGFHDLPPALQAIGTLTEGLWKGPPGSHGGLFSPPSTAMQDQPTWVREALQLRQGGPASKYLLPTTPANAQAPVSAASAASPAPNESLAANPSNDPASLSGRSPVGDIAYKGLLGGSPLISPVGNPAAKVGGTVMKAFFGKSEEAAARAAATKLAAKTGYKIGLKATPVGWILEAVDAAGTPADELRKKFVLQEPTLGNVAWYAADKVLNPGQNIRALGVGLQDAYDMRQDTQAKDLAGASNAVALADEQVRRLQAVATKRPLAPEEQQALLASQTRAAQLREHFSGGDTQRLGDFNAAALSRVDAAREAVNGAQRGRGERSLETMYAPGTPLRDQEDARSYVDHALDRANHFGDERSAVRGQRPPTPSQQLDTLRNHAEQLTRIAVLAAENGDLTTAQKAHAALQTVQGRWQRIDAQNGRDSAEAQKRLSAPLPPSTPEQAHTQELEAAAYRERARREQESRQRDRPAW